ncbi:RES family NAD+ phosphorylase [Longispora sp. NPDC051575]|uniref:RES family NAD+ phosphorylase n=1 Tax=Longispora sp. NPDC051575 TaxID=3154943 RepID=UPI0034388C3F
MRNFPQPAGAAWDPGDPSEDTELFRIHPDGYTALFFGGPKWNSRFSPPDHDDNFGTCHLGYTDEAAFLEKFCRVDSPDGLDGIPLITTTAIANHRISKVKPTRRLKVAGCAAPKATGPPYYINNDFFAGYDYRQTRAWGKALWQADFEGVQYRCHQGSGVNYALAVFGDPADTTTTDVLEAAEEEELSDDLINRMENVYNLPIWQPPSFVC